MTALAPPDSVAADQMDQVRVRRNAAGDAALAVVHRLVRAFGGTDV